MAGAGEGASQWLEAQLSSTVMMSLRLAIVAGFASLSAASIIRWMRVKDSVRAYLALALSLLAIVALLSEAGRLTSYRYRLFSDAGLVAFLASGYCLLMFRHQFLSLSRLWRRLSTAAVVVTAVCALAARLPYGANPHYDSFGNTVILAVVTVWAACVAEPIVRFWTASRGQPSVQRARLRALSLGYALMVAVLVVAVAVKPAEGSVASVLIQIVSLAFVPVLLASFAPPRWLRRAWREREEEDFRIAHDLVMFTSDRGVLAARALHWATRLVGASSGFLAGPSGEILARQSVDERECRAVLAGARAHGGARIVRFDGGNRYAVVVPVRSDEGTATLAVLSGPFTPLFGSDESDRLSRHAAAIGLALDRVHIDEQQRRLDETRSEFIANAAHELRSPLATIVGVASTLKGRENLDPRRMTTGVEALDRQAQRMRALINNLLDLTQMDQGRLRVDCRPVGALPAARQALDASPAPDGVRVDVDIEEGVEVMADPIRLDQVLTNLLTNAYRYGGDRVQIRAEPSSDEVIVSVTDDGPGVPDDLAPHLFDAFARGTNGKVSEGSGLGLTIVRRLTEAFGGDISYEPATPQGARFVLHLRRAA